MSVYKASLRFGLAATLALLTLVACQNETPKQVPSPIPGTTQTVLPTPTTTRTPILSGGKLVYVSGEWFPSNLYVANIKTGQVRLVKASHPDDFIFTSGSITWSPDGKSLAVSPSRSIPGLPMHDVAVIDLDGKLIRKLDARYAVADWPNPPNYVNQFWDKTSKMYFTDRLKGEGVPKGQAMTRDPGFSQPAFSPDGSTLAIGSSGSLITYEASNGKLTSWGKFLSALTARAPAWSPDGRSIAFWASDRPPSEKGGWVSGLAVWDVGTASLQWLSRHGSSESYGPDMSGRPSWLDSQHILMARRLKPLIIDRLTGETTLVIGFDDEMWEPDLSPDKGSIIYSPAQPYWRLGLKIFSLKDRQSRHAFPEGSSANALEKFEIHSPAWSPDGQQIAFFASPPDVHGNDVYMYDSSTNKLVNLTSQLPGEKAYPAISPDGRYVTFTTWATGKSRVWIVDTFGREPPKPALLEEAGEVAELAWSPDGSKWAYSQKSGDRWEIRVADAFSNADPVKVLHGEFSFSPSWSSDSSKVAFVSGTKDNIDVSIWNTQGGVIETLSLPKGEKQSPAWSPDGQSIAFGLDHEPNIVTLSDKRLAALADQYHSHIVGQRAGFIWLNGGQKVGWVDEMDQVHVRNIVTGMIVEWNDDFVVQGVAWADSSR